MALLATHIRFALDVKSRLPVGDVGNYCAGAAYPDSRYVTGVDRRLTHHAESPNDPFLDGLTDFERGWAVHNFYDTKSQPLYLELSPWPKEELRHFSRAWCRLTALKVVEDMSSFSKLGSGLLFLRELSCDIRPMNEDAGRLDLYFDGLRNLYGNEPDLDRYVRLFRSWGIDRRVTDDILTAVADIDADIDTRCRTLVIYAEVLKNFETDL